MRDTHRFELQRLAYTYTHLDNPYTQTDRPPLTTHRHKHIDTHNTLVYLCSEQALRDRYHTHTQTHTHTAREREREREIAEHARTPLAKTP